MNFNNYTQKSIEAVQSAQQLAVQNSHQQMEQVHLLLALLRQEGGLIPQLLKKTLRWKVWKRRQKPSCERSPA